MLKHGPVKILFVLSLCMTAQILCAQDWKEGADLRRNGDLKKAQHLLNKYRSPAGFDQLKPTEKLNYLKSLLELAHIRALNSDVSGSLALLNWAESRPDDYQRAVSCRKYGEILLDLGELERAQAYLKNTNEIIAKHLTDNTPSGAALGQGGEIVDTSAAWRDLRDETLLLNADVESEQLKKKYGATYGQYVKLRRLQQIVKRTKTPRYLTEALKLADEIIKNDSRSQFAAAAGYLKGEILASRLTEDSPKKEIKNVKEYLEKFIKQQPDGLYRGEALMLQGKISLEIEWNAKDAEKYYTQALNWFRKAREKRDSLSLYAAMNDELKKQTEPTQKPTTLNQWKRIVYHREDPLRLYNTANAPVWYVDNQEKECLFASGFCKFLQGDFKASGLDWKQAGLFDNELRHMQAVNFPNILYRLKAAADQRFFVASPDETKKLSEKERLKVAFSDYLFISEKFEESVKICRDLQKHAKSPDCVALALVGEADALRMLNKPDILRIQNLYKKVYTEKQFSKTSAVPRALYSNAWLLLQTRRASERDVLKMFEQCYSKYPKSRHGEASLFHLAVITRKKDLQTSEKYVAEFKQRYSKSLLVKKLEQALNNLSSANKVQKGEQNQ